MIGITKAGGRTTYGLKEYVVDNQAEIDLLPKDDAMGSTAFVIETGDVYMLNGHGEWVKI
jgi:hypothetical protein